MADMDTETTTETTKKKSGISYWALLFVACTLIAFIFLVTANVTGAFIAQAIGLAISTIRA